MHTDVIDGEDVRVIQLPRRASFLLESTDAAGVGCQRLWDQLDGDLTPRRGSRAR